jgi:magnesium-transporting ATPase (P-type)
MFYIHVMTLWPVTGDNILTAVSVARACGMVHHDARVTVAHVTPPVAGKAAHIQWKFIDSPASPDKLEQVHIV